MEGPSGIYKNFVAYLKSQSIILGEIWKAGLITENIDFPLYQLLKNQKNNILAFQDLLKKNG